MILLSVIVVTAVTAATLGTYPFFYSKVVAAYENPLENMDMMSDLNKSSYILYKNLYEKVKGEAVSFGELYVNEEATVEKYQDSKTLEADEYEGSEYADYLSEQACKANVDAYFRERLENDTFKRVEQIYEYAIRDMTTGVVVTNTDKTLLNNPNAYLFRIEMEYDKNGNATIIDLLSENQDNAYKNMSSLLREKNGQLNHWVLEAGYGGWDINEAFVENYPSNCRIVYGVKPDQYAALIDGTLDVNMPYFTYNGHSYYSWNNYHAAMNSGYRQFGVYMILAALALALFLPVSKILGMDLKRFKVFRLPAEGCCALLFLVASAYVAEVDGFISLNNGSAANKILAVLDISSDAATFFSWVWYGMGIFLMYLVVWYIGLCLSRIRTEGFKEYIKSSSLIYRIFPFTKKRYWKFMTDWNILT